MNMTSKLKSVITRIQKLDQRDTNVGQDSCIIIEEAIEKIKEYENYIVDLEYKVEFLHDHAKHLVSEMRKLRYGSKNVNPFLEDYLSVDLSQYTVDAPLTIEIKNRPLVKFTTKENLS